MAKNPEQKLEENQPEISPERQRTREAWFLGGQINSLKEKESKTKEDYQELTKLYKRLERLYEGEGAQELEPWIAEQYEKQLSILQGHSLIHRIEEGKLGFEGIDGKKYPVPSPEELAELIENNREFIESKKEQGFTKLLLVPFGRKLDDLIQAYEETITQHKEENKLFGTKKDPNDPKEELVSLELDENQPVYKWSGYNNADIEGKLVYYPESFDKNNHHGKTKMELLQKENAGWNILLIEDMPNIPETDPKTIGGRTQIDAFGNAMEKFLSGKEVPTPKEYLSFLDHYEAYRGEQGMTPEDQLMYAISHLEETDQVIDDYQGNGKISYQIGAYFPSSDVVPYAYWSRGARQASLGGYGAENRDDDCGVRPAVRLKKS